MKHIGKNKKILNYFLKIFKKYQQQLEIFENNEIKNILSQHKFWNYKILLKLNIKPTFEFMWFLF